MKVSVFAGAVLEPVILLSQAPKYWDYKHALPRPATSDLESTFITIMLNKYWGLNPEALYLRSTHTALFYFYFETGSDQVDESLSTC